jgi:hypothetical protein
MPDKRISNEDRSAVRVSHSDAFVGAAVSDGAQ